MNHQRLGTWTVQIVLGLLLVLGSSGCIFMDSSGSFYDSSGSLFDLSGSAFDSFSSSSGGDALAYREDIRDFTVGLASLNGRPEELRRGIAEIALGRGISDWEVIALTYSSVGQGLAQVGVSDDRLLAYGSALARPGSENYRAIALGYASVRP